MLVYCDKCGVSGDGYYYPAVCQCCRIEFSICWYCLGEGNDLSYIRYGLCKSCERDKKIGEILFK